MVVIYILISIWFVWQKQKNEDAKDDDDDPQGSEAAKDFDSAWTEAVDNVTGSLGAVTSIVWFSMFPDACSSPWSTIGITCSGTLTICILEFIERSLPQVGVAGNVMDLLGTSAQGTLAWHVGMSMYIAWKKYFNVVDPNPMTYWEWLILVISAAIHFEVISCISSHCCQSKTEKAYATNVFKFWKGAPVKSSHLALRDIVEFNWAKNMFAGTFVWTAGTLTFLPLVEQARKMFGKLTGCGASEDVVDRTTSETVTLISHVMSWLCGNLFGDAIIGYILGTTWYAEQSMGVHRVMWAVLGLLAILIAIALVQVRFSYSCVESEDEFEELSNEEEEEE
jgi:hypothetical protein